MTLKYALTNIFLQVMIACISGFTMMTQFGSIRQPTKLFIQIIFVLSLISLIINVVNYRNIEKD